MPKEKEKLIEEGTEGHRGKGIEGTETEKEGTKGLRDKGTEGTGAGDRPFGPFARFYDRFMLRYVDY
ncbi:hypothetical protein JXB37_07870, partial [candidate division WOR-3 bacterium]|nr:hypothetical protein [candidate division WOR-3 bacterium]